MRYSAFGEMRYLNGETVTDLLYTSQRLEEEIGLYYYGARWYDSALGRFIQADTLIPDPGSSAAYDRYAYVNNNPLKYTDPTGHKKVPGGPGGVTIVYDGDDDQPDVFDYPSLWIPGIGGSNINYGNAYFAENGEYEEYIEGVREGTKYEAAVAGFVIGTYGTLAYLSSKGIIGAGTTAVEAACADGDCTNEVNGIAKTAESVVDKLQRYLLNPEHEIGGPKANWFKQALGFTRDNLYDLAEQIVFNQKTAIETTSNQWGAKVSTDHYNNRSKWKSN